MFAKNGNCPPVPNIRAKQLKSFLIAFFLVLIVAGKLSTISAAGSTKLEAYRSTLVSQKSSFLSSDLFARLEARIKAIVDRANDRFFRQLADHASPRMIIVNPEEKPTPSPRPTIPGARPTLTLTPTPTLIPTPTVSPEPTVTPTEPPIPTTSPTLSPTVTPVPTAVPTTTPTTTPAPTQPPLSSVGYEVSGGVIHKNGQKLALNGVNWFGFETANNAPHGLWSRSYKEMIAQVKSLGFNSLRIPFCPNTVKNGPVSGIDYSKNPDLEDLNGLEVMDKIIAELEAQELYFLLDHHRPDCSTISELPAIPGYSEEDWVSDLVFLARRYQDKNYFIGIDLKNEPHGAATWGTGDETDWKRAAEKAGRTVLEANPNLLIFVEGVQNNPRCSDNSIAHWWGGNLEPQACYPIDLPAQKLVLSPHVYGPDVFAQEYFNVPDFPANMPAIWEKHFGFLAGDYALAVGEWGGRYQGKDKIWQDALADWLAQKGICNSFYWSLNPNSGDTGGILNDDWQTVRQDKVEMLRDYAQSCRQ